MLCVCVCVFFFFGEGGRGGRDGFFVLEGGGRERVFGLAEQRRRGRVGRIGLGCGGLVGVGMRQGVGGVGCT